MAAGIIALALEANPGQILRSHDSPNQNRRTKEGLHTGMITNLGNINFGMADRQADQIGRFLPLGS
jgi:hypothetical protein